MLGVGISAFLISYAYRIKIDLYVNGESWSIETIGSELGMSLPKDATDVLFEGHRGRGGFLELSFTSPRQSMTAFVDPICNGRLYESYDPFDAIDFGEPFTFAHRIEVGQYAYYSYSLNTPDTISGNRCQAPSGKSYQIRLDTSDTISYQLRLHVFFSCEICHVFYPKIVIPIPDFPVYLMGLRSEPGGYSLPFEELCVGLQLSTDYLRKGWEDLEGGNLTVYVNRALVLSAHIYSGALTSRHDKNGNMIEADQSGDSESYCFVPGLQIGIHELTFQIQTVTSRSHRYDWLFHLKPAKSTAYLQGSNAGSLW